MAKLTGIASLPQELIHIVLDPLELEHILKLLSTRNKYLIDTILNHSFWGKLFAGHLNTYCDAIDLASAFDTMRDAAQFMRYDGPASIADRYEEYRPSETRHRARPRRSRWGNAPGWIGGDSPW